MLEMKDITDLTLMDQLDELVAFEPNGFPFISLYLNMQPDQHGRDNFESFVRKEFNAKARSYAAPSSERGANRIREVARSTPLVSRLENLRRLRRRRRVSKIRDFSARQLMERKMSLRTANG